MNTQIGIVVACFSGAVIGALLALQLEYFWWIGILAGGGVGYISFRFKEAVRSAYRVWQKLPEAAKTAAALREHLWNSACVVSALMAILCLAGSMVVMILGVLMSLLVGTEMASGSEGAAEAAANLGMPNYGWIKGATVVLAIGLATLLLSLRTAKGRAAFRMAFNCFLMTPLVLPIMLAVAFTWAIVPPLTRRTLKLGKLCIQAARHTFILIHSELRLLCMTDAMIGGLAGYFCGNALIGGLVGAVCGYANYKLVSVRLLKLVKA